jgi:hypothetical protein
MESDPLRRFLGPKYRPEVINDDLPGTVAHIDTAVHEGFHALVARHLPTVTDLVDFKYRGVPYGAPMKYIEETFAMRSGTSPSGGFTGGRGPDRSVLLPVAHSSGETGDRDRGSRGCPGLRHLSVSEWKLKMFMIWACMALAPVALALVWVSCVREGRRRVPMLTELGLTTGLDAAVQDTGVRLIVEADLGYGKEFWAVPGVDVRVDRRTRAIAGGKLIVSELSAAQIRQVLLDCGKTVERIRFRF